MGCAIARRELGNQPSSSGPTSTQARAAATMDLLRAAMPFQPDADLNLTPGGGDGGRHVGLVLVDISNGFCTVGAGNLVS
ncbi:hypothetical protein GUJ93_ZPchr0002g24524 [Zizania palustris]|uniref:Uncharacterized protein n=1 Tax=Zizania palustris TaxID=103762 RepID=A0A8J5SCP0_ZIZPA|nr:hypothetical protein GUJ93_ZPchr0002g24524 [Zizania palustris]